MSSKPALALPLLAALTLVAQQPPNTTQFQPASTDGKLRVIVIGAHPDDCDFSAGGVAAKYARLGHHVKFVALTTGDNGHPTMGGGALAARRRAEAAEAGRRLGIDAYIVLENHSGELFPTLDMRRAVVRLIREWRADIVMLPRPWDYHPDHRATSQLVQDAAYLVTVPFFTSDTPALFKNPVFLYVNDRFTRPNPIRIDVAIDIDDAIDAKVDALDAHVSQMYEWGPFQSGTLDQVPKDPAARKAWLRKNNVERRSRSADMSAALEKRYPGKGSSVRYAEGFEICELGRRPSEKELRELFPF
jgi:LmbE family N-acetylglucosaminyl deacetylase